jgi:predicted nuclease of predicted toxin-antitoxin system
LKNKVAPLVVLLDEGAPAQVADSFVANGHTVIHHRDVLAPGAKDDLVCATAIMNNACLIAVDRDMKQMAKRFGNPDKGGKFPKLHLIFMNCNGVIAPKRIAQAISFIEHEWAFTCQKQARALWIDISPHRITSNR